MEILFCDRCHESIPDADLENGKAVRVAGRVLHLPCAFRRAMPGPGRTLTLVLALLAAGGAAYAVTRTLQRPGDEGADERLSAAWRKDVDAATARLRGDVQTGLANQRKAIGDDVAQAVAKARDEIAASQRLEMERAVATLNGKVEAYTDANLKRFEAGERQMAEIASWVKEVRDMAGRSGAAAPGATAPSAPEAPPRPSAPAAPAAPPTPAPAAPSAPPMDPEAKRRHDAEVDRWIERLKDPDAGVSFSATYKLKDLKDLRAVPALVETLQRNKDYYTRLGAATALGELKACDAVPALIEALEDKEDLVQTAAGEALTTITGRDGKMIVGLTKRERRQMKDEWVRWWKEHEAAVRQRLGQPGTAPPAK